jgi:hypothetical protein
VYDIPVVLEYGVAVSRPRIKVAVPLDGHSQNGSFDRHFFKRHASGISYNLANVEFVVAHGRGAAVSRVVVANSVASEYNGTSDKDGEVGHIVQDSRVVGGSVVFYRTPSIDLAIATVAQASLYTVLD